MSSSNEKIYHLSIRNISRNKYKSVPSRMAYGTGIEITDEKTGLKYHHKKKQIKEGLETEMVLNPEADEKFKDTNYFFNRINQAEKRSDARVFKEMDVALFTDLTPEQNKELAREYCRTLSEKYKTPISMSFHKLDSHNPHAHIIFSEREVIGEELSAKKIQPMRKKGFVKDCRAIWSERANEYFKEAEKNMFIDHRSHKDRGLEKEPLKRINPHSKIQDTEAIKLQNKIIKIENKEIDYKEKRKELRNERQDLTLISKRQRRDALSRAAVTNENREEVITVAEQARSLNQKPKSKVVTVHRLYENAIKEKENKFFQARQLHAEQRMLNKGVNKEKYKERKSLFKEQRAKSKNNISLKKGDIIDLKFGIQDLKADLKAYSVFSPSNWKERRKIKKEIAKNKVKIKKKKYEIKKEKNKQRLQKEKYKEHRKEYATSKKIEYGYLKDKIANKLKAKVLNREKNQVKNKVIENTNGNVINLADYKKTNKIEKIKSAERNQGRAR